MFARAFVNQGFAQQPVIQHALQAVVVNLFMNVYVEFGVDMQRLCCTQFVLQYANSGIQGQLLEKNTSGGHGRVPCRIA